MSKEIIEICSIYRGCFIKRFLSLTLKRLTFLYVWKAGHGAIFWRVFAGWRTFQMSNFKWLWGIRLNFTDCMCYVGFEWLIRVNKTPQFRWPVYNTSTWDDNALKSLVLNLQCGISCVGHSSVLHNSGQK